MGPRVGFALREAPEPHDSGRTLKPAAAVFHGGLDGKRRDAKPPCGLAAADLA